MTVPGFEALDHTADYAIRAWGADISELIQAAAVGMMSLVLDAEDLEPAELILLEVEADIPEQLVQHCLREVLILFEDGEVPVRIHVTAIEDPPHASLAVGIVPLDQVRDRLLGEIKAVTYHNLRIGREPGRLTLEVVFDT
jgi:SHS2 domain-containing protein